MSEITEACFAWEGSETIDAVQAKLASPARIEITLPPEYNHELFAQLMPDAPPGRAEQLDMEGDVGLLRVVARIEGLEDLASLIGPLSRLSARVKMRTPPTIVIILD